MKPALVLPEVGAEAELTIEVTAELVERFAELTGDRNPLHMDEAFARAAGFPGRVAHGMSYAAFLSTLIGTRLPGPGALWASQTYRFLAPVCVGQRVRLRSRVVESAPASRTVRLAVTAETEDGTEVMEGESVVMVPGAKADPAAAPRRAASRDRAVALVAGAGGGLGAAIAAALARSGFALALGGRNERRLEEVAAGLRAAEATAVPVRLDLTSDASVEAALAAACEQLGPPAVVVHVASDPLPRAGVAETGFETYRRHFETQAGGLYRLARAAMAPMAARGGGQIIYVGSTAARGVPPKGMAAYSAGKAAAASLTRSLALELAPQGIRANIVSPHFLATDLTAHVAEKARKLAAAQVPLRRLAELDEVASAVAFLAGAGGAYVNGHDLVVDGGATMT